MVARSFEPGFIDDLLSSNKEQTTREPTPPPKPPRVKVGDAMQIYVLQRVPIVDKPVRQMTAIGTTAMANWVNDPKYNYPAECPIMPTGLQYDMPHYYAHFLGIVEITEVYDIHPIKMTDAELEAWALADGFGNFNPPAITMKLIRQSANWWFADRYGNDWMQRTWTVSKWDGWLERYFEPELWGVAP